MDTRITRILLVSPEATETLKRNRSRVFVWPRGETIIDAMIFQSQRDIAEYGDVLDRAMNLSGLTIHNGDGYEILEQPNTVGMQKFFSTNGWLVDEENNVFDMIIEVAAQDEELGRPDITSIAPLTSDGDSENPLIFSTSTKELRSGGTQIDGSQDSNVTEIPRQESSRQPGERQEQQMQPQSIAARRSQESEGESVQEDTSGRMPGKPGRVKSPFDGRLKQNRINNN